MKNLTFAILGGDNRQRELINELTQDGHLVHSHGLKDECTLCGLKNSLLNSKFVLLPMPVSRDGKKLYAPFSKRPVPLKNVLNNSLFKNKIIFTPGLSTTETKILSEVSNMNIILKYCTEEFLVNNAKLTAKAAMTIAKEKLKINNLTNLKVLICGFGRVGKALTLELKNKCKNLAVSARKEKDFLEIKKLGIQCIHTANIAGTSEYNLIFNTIPSPIFNEYTLKNTVNENTLFVDLASSPFGIDERLVKKTNINYVRALGLPGKYYPKESGILIKNSIFKIMKGEHLI